MIAMALSCQPDLLIADEPTTALDVTIQAQILESMKALQKKTNTSILYISHNLGVIAELCDTVCVMYAGKIVERGNVFKLFKKPHHPYTFGLLRSIPSMHQDTQELFSIKGVVPHPFHLPQGCRFAPRCSDAFKKCFESMPIFTEIDIDHWVCCWKYL